LTHLFSTNWSELDEPATNDTNGDDDDEDDDDDEVENPVGQVPV
jgi:hypothetical protein